MLWLQHDATYILPVPTKLGMANLRWSSAWEAGTKAPGIKGQRDCRLAGVDFPEASLIVFSSACRASMGWKNLLFIRGIHPRTSQVDHCVHRGSTKQMASAELGAGACPGNLNACRRHAVSLVSKASPKPGVRCCSASFWPHLCYLYATYMHCYMHKLFLKFSLSQRHHLVVPNWKPCPSLIHPNKASSCIRIWTFILVEKLYARLQHWEVRGLSSRHLSGCSWSAFGPQRIAEIQCYTLTQCKVWRSKKNTFVKSRRLIWD